MDLPPTHPIPGQWTPPPPPCPYLVVLGGRECACPVVGPHTTHRYRSPSGQRREFELVDLDG